MSCDIECQRFRDIEQDSDFSDKFIQLALLLAVIVIAVVFCQYGEYIGRSIAITVDDVLQLRLDAHREHLPRFVACIGQYAVMDVAVAQVDHIYERHAAGEETEHEDVACEGVLGMQRREGARLRVTVCLTVRWVKGLGNEAGMSRFFTDRL